jgi:uncharacterized repeat protein (TIGR03803 family)
MKYQGKALSMFAATLFAVAAASAQTYTVKHTYTINSGNTSGIAYPQVMSQGRDGNIYGTISNAGTHSEGSVFKITPAGTLTTIYSFCSVTSCTDGTGPAGGVILGFDGNLYGTACCSGGTGKAGTVFKVTPGGTLTTLHRFGNGNDDSLPSYTLLQAQDGNFYGVSEIEYNTQNGAFFKVTAAGAFSVLHDFNYTDGRTPNLPTQGTDGNLYGTANVGGSKGYGVVYKMTSAGKITILHNFLGGATDGCYPAGTLTQGNDGNFYGVTWACGAHGTTGKGGTVYKISPSGATYSILYSFCAVAYCTDGNLPLAGLTLGTDGNFYGTSGGGTKNAGTIYKITPAGVRTSLYNFCDPTCNGYYTGTPLVQHTNGKFYGNTSGNSLGGAVFYSMSVGLKPFVRLVTWNGKVGRTVEILGQGFTGTTQVLFNGTPATFTNVSDTYMTAVVPDGATTGYVTVTTFTASYKSDRKFLVTPQITSVSPASAKVGATLTINGVSLTQTSKVTVGGVSATFTLVSDDKVTAKVPAGAKTGQKISVTTAGGVASSPAVFAVVPAITSFSPTSGKVGTSVTITGNSFTGTTKVTFGGVAATSYQVITDTQLGALVPTGAVTGKIAVTTAGGTGTSASNFTVTQ